MLVEFTEEIITWFYEYFLDYYYLGSFVSKVQWFLKAFYWRTQHLAMTPISAVLLFGKFL